MFLLLTGVPSISFASQWSESNNASSPFRVHTDPQCHNASYLKKNTTEEQSWEVVTLETSDQSDEEIWFLKCLKMVELMLMWLHVDVKRSLEGICRDLKQIALAFNFNALMWNRLTWDCSAVKKSFVQLTAYGLWWWQSWWWCSRTGWWWRWRWISYCQWRHFAFDATL